MTNVTIENVEFTSSIRPTFKGSCTIKNCTFTATESNAFRQAAVNSGATLTIKDCVFNLNDFYKEENGYLDTGAIHFKGNENGTVILDGCIVNSGYMSFGRTMNVEIKNTVISGTSIGAYGDMTLTGCTFTPDTVLYINPNTGNSAVTMTLNGCTVTDGSSVVSIIVDYSENMTTDIDWKFVVDGVVYDENSVFTTESAVAEEDA